MKRIDLIFFFLSILSKRTLLSSSSSFSALLSCKTAKIRRSRVSRRHRTHFSIVNLSHQFFLFFLSTDTHVSYQHDCATNTKNWSVQRALSASFGHIPQHDDHLQFLHVFSLLISSFFFCSFFLDDTVPVFECLKHRFYK